jgi:hypothetical protein
MLFLRYRSKRPNLRARNSSCREQTMKTVTICISALAGLLFLSGCAYDGYAYNHGYYGRYGYNGYYNRYGYNGYYGPYGYGNRYAYNGYNGRSRVYTLDGVQYDCLSKFNAAYCL